MRARLLTLGILLLAACSGGEDDPTGTGGNNDVSLVGEQVVCDSCASARFVLAGPGIAGVRSATLISSDLRSTTLPARVSLDRVSDDDGDRLIVTAYFDQGVPEGEFDLWLDPPTVGDAARIVPAALRVTRALPGPGTLGTVRVWVQVGGEDRDVRFTFRTLDGCPTVACAPLLVEPYTMLTQSLAPGAYTFELDDVAANCTIQGSPNPATLTLQRGVAAALSYRVTCAPVTNPGWVRVANVTTGPDLDESYQVSCAGLDCRTFTLAVNRDSVLRLAPGELALSISEVAPHCSLTSPATVPLTVSPGDTATATFVVTCGDLPNIRATVQTSGRQIDDSVQIAVCDDSYNATCRYRTVSSNGEVTFPGLAPGYYFVSLSDLAGNCQSRGPQDSMVQVQGSDLTVNFTIECQGDGLVRISAVTSGTNPDLSYRVVHDTGCDGWYYACPERSLSSPGSAEFGATAGIQTFWLQDVASNCAVVAPSNPAAVTVVEGGVVELRFEVACQ